MIFTYEHNGETIRIKANNKQSADYAFAKKYGDYNPRDHHGCDCHGEADCECEETVEETPEETPQEDGEI